MKSVIVSQNQYLNKILDVHPLGHFSHRLLHYYLLVHHSPIFSITLVVVMSTIISWFKLFAVPWMHFSHCFITFHSDRLSHTCVKCVLLQDSQNWQKPNFWNLHISPSILYLFFFFWISIKDLTKNVYQIFDHSDVQCDLSIFNNQSQLVQLPNALQCFSECRCPLQF